MREFQNIMWEIEVCVRKYDFPLALEVQFIGLPGLVVVEHHVQARLVMLLLLLLAVDALLEPREQTGEGGDQLSLGEILRNAIFSWCKSIIGDAVCDCALCDVADLCGCTTL